MKQNTKIEGENKMRKSINQIAQELNDTSANEAIRIRNREAIVNQAWRKIAFIKDIVTIDDMIKALPEFNETFIRFVSENYGNKIQ